MLRATGRLLLPILVLACCAPAVKRTGAAPTRAQLAELWIDPADRPRDLFQGPPSLDGARPERNARYEVLERDVSGFSITYRVRDTRGRVWHAKIGPESQTEVVASRIVWAVGCHEMERIRVEDVRLARSRVPFELRAASKEELQYEVRWPVDRRTDRISEAILAIDANAETAVD